MTTKNPVLIFTEAVPWAEVGFDILVPKLGGENKSAVENKCAMETFPALSNSPPSDFKDFHKGQALSLPSPNANLEVFYFLNQRSSDSSGLQTKNCVTPTVQQRFWNKTSEQGDISFFFLCFFLSLFLIIWSIESVQRDLQRNFISKEQKWITVWTQAAHQRKMCQRIKTMADSSTGCDFQSSSERTFHFHQDVTTLNKSHTMCWCNSALFFSQHNLQETNADPQTNLGITEASNDRMLWAGNGLKCHLILTCCHGGSSFPKGPYGTSQMEYESSGLYRPFLINESII